jgi:CRISPR/Cas system-associated exonuclease Cas4 (RecB family)
MQIDAEDISIYSKCPRYYWFWKTIQRPPIGLRFSVIEEIIKRAYIKRTEYSKKVEWRVILGWIDRAVFHKADIQNQEQVETLRKLAESIIEPIQHWYGLYYLKESNDAFVNVPLEYNLNSHLISAVIPIVKLGDIPAFTFIDERERTNAQILSDMELRIKAWLVLKQFKLSEAMIEHYGIGKESVIGYNKVKIRLEMCDRMDAMIDAIASSIYRKTDYPSITEKCDQCQFRSKCII